MVCVKILYQTVMIAIILGKNDHYSSTLNWLLCLLELQLNMQHIVHSYVFGYDNTSSDMDHIFTLFPFYRHNRSYSTARSHRTHIRNVYASTLSDSGENILTSLLLTVSMYL